MNRYPLVEEASTLLTAPELFELIRDKPYSFFLDSGMDAVRLGRYSFMGSDPFLVLSSRGSEVILARGEESEVLQDNPFVALDRLLKTYELSRGPVPVPFAAGAVGYLSYDLRHFVERLSSAAVDDLRLPECYFAFYDSVFAFDHLEGKTYVVATGFPEQEERHRLRRARVRLSGMRDWLNECPSSAGLSQGRVQGKRQEQKPGGPGWPVPEISCTYREGDTTLRSNFTREEYVRAVERVREHIAAGDAFQVNLSQRFDTALQFSPYELYKRLRLVNPAPFAAYLDYPGVAVVSASPERFLKRTGDTVETRPIKGTRPRGSDRSEDRRLARELTESGKDRAENIMIVDLERNDLGRVCRYGTVKVTELAALEAFPTVFHLTSTIVGTLLPGIGNAALLQTVFPGGSITGAPKVRAMEIIDELEPTRRSVYSGCIGYLGFNGDLDMNIAIRTILVTESRAYFQVGGGIIYDSDPEAEYVETLDKARGLTRALQLASDVPLQHG